MEARGKFRVAPGTAVRPFKRRKRHAPARASCTLLEGSVWRASNEHGILQQHRKISRGQRTYRLRTVGVGGICRGVSVSVSVKKKASGWVWEEMAAFLEEVAGIKSPWEERRVWRTYPL